MADALRSKVTPRPSGDRVPVKPLQKRQRGGLIVPDRAEGEPREGGIGSAGTGTTTGDGRGGDRTLSGVSQYLPHRSVGTVACLVAVILLSAGSPQGVAAAEPPAEPVYKVVSPTGDSTVKTTAMAPRLDTLKGKTVCLVGNRSFKADVTLPAIGEALKKQFPGVKIVPYDALPVAPLPEPPGAPRKESEALQTAFKAKGCDAVIAGNGG